MSVNSLAVLLVAAALSGLVAKLFKQPLILGYLLAGLVLGATGFLNGGHDIEALGQIGVTLLLFVVGMEMKLHDIKTIGKSMVSVGVGQIMVTSVVGFGIAILLGFSILPAVYIAIALTFSSTIIIIKLLSEKNDLESLYGKISVGLLLVQDFVAVLILMFLSGLRSGGITPFDFGFLVIKAVLLLGAVVYLSKKVIPQFFDRFVANSTELLFIFSIAWALGIAAFVAGPLGFTLEVGGFLAGIALSNLGEQIQIASKTRPVRDFFLTIFFLVLGTQLVITNIGAILVPAIVFTLFVVVGNPLIVMIVMGVLGYKKRTSFFASVTMAQVSEFSLILMAMGALLGHVSQNDVAIVVLVTVISMVASTYLILDTDRFYNLISKKLSIFERKKTKEVDYGEEVDFKDHVIVLGGGRTSQTLISLLRYHKFPFVVVDFNPEVFTSFIADNMPVLFGDIADEEVFAKAKPEAARAVISTTASFSDNLSLILLAKKANHKLVVIVEASTKDDALKLYEQGADYVILTRQLMGEHLRQIFKSSEFESKKVKKLGKGILKRLLT